MTPPDVVNPGDKNTSQGPFFADTVIAFRSGGAEPTLCENVTRTCPEAQTGNCAPNAALGKNDDGGKSFVVGASSSIDVGFMCSIGIREVGTDPSHPDRASDDFKIFGTVDGGAFPTVQVSNDGTNYFALNLWAREPNDKSRYTVDSGFQLEAANVAQVRYVRIAETSGKGSISVDAVEALALTLGQ